MTDRVDDIPAPAPADERAAWQTGVPPVREGSYAGFIVACRRKYNGNVYVFEANYANQYADELRDDDGEEFTAHGWYDVAQDLHGEYSSVFSKTCDEGDEILGWQPLPKWSDESARASSANETGAEGALGYAQRLATSLWEKHWRDSAPQWKVLDDTLGVLTQIDNMVCGLQRAPAQAAEPVAWLGHGNYYTKSKKTADRLGYLMAVYAGPQPSSIPAGWMLIPKHRGTKPLAELIIAASLACVENRLLEDDDRHELAQFADQLQHAPQPPAQADAREGLTDAVVDAAKSVVREALDSVSVHPCDEHDDEVRARQLPDYMQKLYRALLQGANHAE